MQLIQSGATLGMLGGGQLGRMFTQAATKMGYDVTVLDPDPLSPTGQIASRHLQTPYIDPESLDILAKTCSAVSIEFESVPAAALHTLHGRVRLCPPAKAVEIAQNRLLEKTFIREHGLPTADFFLIESDRDAREAFFRFNRDCILKTATLGYDGKGQALCSKPEDVPNAFKNFGSVTCILEDKIPLRTEVSVVLARYSDGVTACFPVAENTHVNGILETSVVPAQVEPKLRSQAQDMAIVLANKLQYIGVLGVEMFVSKDDELLINEIAPRPHNSGHYTLDATVTSQFEQQVRVMCGLPAGETTLTTPVAMLNLLGDVWATTEPDWQEIIPENGRLHLYGKKHARPGRKMGHINVMAETSELALRDVQRIKNLL